MRPRAVEKKYEVRKLRNPVEKYGSGEWTNWGCASGQTGGATKSALATTRNDCHKFRRCPGLLHMLQNPIMYDTWGGASNIFIDRSLWSKIPCSGGVRSPDPLTRSFANPPFWTQLLLLNCCCSGLHSPGLYEWGPSPKCGSTLVQYSFHFKSTPQLIIHSFATSSYPF